MKMNITILNKKNLFLTVILILITIMVIVVIPKFIVTAPEVGTTVLLQTINNNKSTYEISKNDMNKIHTFYKSTSEWNLPKPKLEFGKLVKLNKFVNQEITISELLKKSDGTHQLAVTFDFTKYSEEAYNNGNGYEVENSYNGIIFFAIEKLGFNKWQIRDVKIDKISPNSN